MSERTLTLFISAGPDMAPECDLLGRIVAQLPATMGWHILRTPENDVPVDREGIQNCDVYIILLGVDLVAPMGMEWLLAKRARRTTFAFVRSDVPHSPAAQAFLRDSGLQWIPFKHMEELARRFEQQLIRHLLDHPELGVHVEDVEQLTTRLQELEAKSKEMESSQSSGSPDAERGGVVLPRS